MANRFLLLCVTPVSAFLDASALSVFFLPQNEHFDEVWNTYYFDYETFATVAFAASCDWSPHGGFMTTVPDDGLETSCGLTCKLLTEKFDGTMPVSYNIFSPSDHISITTFRKPRDACNEVSGTVDCSIYHQGSFFTEEGSGWGVAWFLSFRGTFLWDVVNHRRNVMYTLVLVPMCAQCAAIDGPYRNFVSLRYAVARAVLATGTSLPSTQQGNLALVGVSMGGQLAQFTAAFLSAERSIVSQNVLGLVTFGVPRVANRQLAKHIAAGVDVPYTQFVMYRDAVPHTPPLIFGVKSASPKIYLLYVEPWFWAKKATGDARTSSHSFDAGFMKYKEFVGSEADEEFSHQFTFFDINDHLKYFLLLDESTDLAACGGLEDKYFLNTAAISMYDNV